MARLPRFISAGTAVDKRGTLRFVQCSQHLPFVPKRVFWITDIPQDAMRGGHAHQTCVEALFVLRGRFTLDIITGSNENHSFNIEEGGQGVIINAGEWCVLRDFSEDTLIMVMASEEYRPEGYIHDFAQFRQRYLC